MYVNIFTIFFSFFFFLVLVVAAVVKRGVNNICSFCAQGK